MMLLWMGCLRKWRPGYAKVFQEEISHLFDTVSLGLQRHGISRDLRGFQHMCRYARRSRLLGDKNLSLRHGYKQNQKIAY